ncbi:uncharacterized protein [Diadema antillarum]|uniref:uncharacterized protein n=1 Tax=Diadema antillarum TaxID=105358 RepID=UPI003A865757
MATISNKFAILEDEGDTDLSFKINEVVEGAMQLVPDREGGNKQLVEEIVKAVVAALLPMVQSIAHQLVSGPQVQVQATVQNYENRLDEVEQYSRRDNVIMRGVPENDGESTNAVVIDVAASAGVAVSEADISTSHRMGRPQPNKMRPIARFVRRDLRTQLLRSKRKLKDSEQHKDMIIMEHLSPVRAKLLQAVKQDENAEKVWTIDGKVHSTLKSDPHKKHIIHGPDDLFKRLGWSEDKLKKSLPRHFDRGITRPSFIYRFNPNLIYKFEC